jgi:hypothetical protein
MAGNKSGHDDGLAVQRVTRRLTLPLIASADYASLIRPACSVLDERMFECSFSFMKSSPVSSQSIWASIAAANFGMASLKEKSGTSILIF